MFETKISSILEKGSGSKVALFDSHTKLIISSLITQTKFLETDFFLFHMLSDQRAHITSLTAVVFLRPESIYDLICELKDPRYGRYIIFFTNKVELDVLEILAKSDLHNLIFEVFEMNIDVIRIDKNIFQVSGNTTGSKNGLSDSAVSSILSVLSTLGISPNILTHKSFQKTPFLQTAEKIKNFTQKFLRQGLFIFINRSFDPITPLMYEWRYQCMINEYFETPHNQAYGIVKIDKLYSFSTDDFFQANKFLDINRVSNNLKKFVDQQNDKISLDNFKIKDSAEMHLKIHNHIVQMCMANKEFSELEMKILKENKINSKQLEFTIKGLTVKYGQEIDFEHKIRKLVLIFLLKNPKKSKNAFFQKYLKILSYVQKHSEIYLPTFKEHTDIKLAYEPPIINLLSKIFKNKYEKHFDVLTDNKYNFLEKKDKPFIIYINEITLGEYRAIDAFFKERNIDEFYIICDKIIKWQDIAYNL